MSVTGMHHVAMRVAQFDDAVDFYSNVLDLPKALEWKMNGTERAIMFDCGNGAHVEIFEHPDAPAPEEKGLIHFALTTDDVDSLTEKARAAGCEVTMEPRDVEIPSDPSCPVRISFFKGPCGETIELFAVRS